jgi:hypothetical protein
MHAHVAWSEQRGRPTSHSELQQEKQKDIPSVTLAFDKNLQLIIYIEEE